MEEINDILNISPLFAIEAEKLLVSGKLREAANLCMKGLKKYPNYETAHLILIKAFKGLNEFDKASQSLHGAPILIKSKISLEELNSKLPEEREGDTEESDTDEKVSPLQNTDFKSEDFTEETLPEKEYHNAIKDDSLKDDLIETLPGRKSGSSLDIEDTLTLAKIYEAQDAWAQALEIYENYLTKNPDKRNEFSDKLRELNALVEDED